MKSTFLLHLVHAGASDIREAIGSLTFVRQGDCSPETAIVNFNETIEHCVIESASSHCADADIQNVSGKVILSSGFMCIHLGIVVDKQKLTGAVGGIARYTSTATDAGTVMTVHGHMLSDADERDREGATESLGHNGTEANEAWEGNTGW